MTTLPFEKHAASSSTSLEYLTVNLVREGYTRRSICQQLRCKGLDAETVEALVSTAFQKVYIRSMRLSGMQRVFGGIFILALGLAAIMATFQARDTIWQPYMLAWAIAAFGAYRIARGTMRLTVNQSWWDTDLDDEELD